MAAHRAGFVALIGNPNVGKSTLLNTFVGQKVSIVSDKKQTTRRKLLGISTGEDAQIVFLDTPGIHAPHTQLGKLMVNAAHSALSEVDVVLVVVDCSHAPSKEDQMIAEALGKAGWMGSEKLILCLNKMDLLKAIDVTENVEGYCAMFRTERYMLTSLTKKQNLEKLRQMIVEALPEGERLFDEDALTDQPMRKLAADLIQEKALRLTRQEVPHAIATIVDAWEETDELAKIAASIVVEKEGQKAILIGQRGQMLKRIGTQARLEIEDLIGKHVYLELFVKVKTDWRQNPRMLKDLELTE